MKIKKETKTQISVVTSEKFDEVLKNLYKNPNVVSVQSKPNYVKVKISGHDVNLFNGFKVIIKFI